MKKKLASDLNGFYLLANCCDATTVNILVGRIQLKPEKGSISLSAVREVVLVGGGHTHIQTLKSFAQESPKKSRITVVVDVPLAVYSGMVPGFVSGQYSKDEIVIDVFRLSQRANARLIIGRVVQIDPNGQKIFLENGETIPYDVASFDIGSTVAGTDVSGVNDYAIPTRPIGRLCHQIEEVIEQVIQGDHQKSVAILVVGGGAGGVELSFTLQKRFGSLGLLANVTMIEKDEELLLDYSTSIRKRILSHMGRRGISIICNAEVCEVGSDSVVLENGQNLDFDLLIWVTGPWSQEIFKESGLSTDARGFVLVRSTLQFVEYDNLFGVGDCATLVEAPLTPKAGVYAVRQGPCLTHNLYRWLDDGPLRNYHPQADFLTLLNLGDGSAVGGKWGYSIEGRWVMELKDYIDRKFVADFS